MRRTFYILLLFFSELALFSQTPISFMNFETPTVHGMDLSPSGKLLAVCNLADGRVEFFATTNSRLTSIGSVPVGIDPVTVRFRNENELWVVNHISQSINIIDTQSLHVTGLIQTAPRPTDLVFAGAPERAFVAESLDNRIAVYDPASLTLVTNIPVLAQRPTALAASADHKTVFCTVKESGNHTTILSRKLTSLATPSVPGAVEHAGGPYSGKSPPPNAGSVFDPPINPALGANSPPPVGLIVRRMDGGRWRDDNNGDWTEYITGTNAAMSGRIQGWDMLDHDLIALNTEDLTVSYFDSLMTICLGIAVNPVTGAVNVVGTEAFNHVRFEPKLNGVFATVQFATVDPATGSKHVQDLNPHLDYKTPTIPLPERLKSLGDPRGMVWTSDGKRCFVAGRGSDNLLVLDEEGKRVGDPLQLPEGPESLALNEAQGELYVLNRFDASISVINVGSYEIVQTVRLFDPTPRDIKIGRKQLYNTHLTSGLGHLSCATCHVDARTDRLAWDLGNPAGDFIPRRGIIFGFFPGFHPIKGPMLTQTFQDSIGHEPLHWRGDRSKIEEFNVTFRDLLGTEQKLGRVEMRQFRQMLSTIQFPPNPNLQLNGSYSTNLPLPGFFTSGKIKTAAGEPLSNGNALLGSTFGGCAGCHTLPAGIGFPVNEAGEIISFVQAQTENLAFKVVHFRNLLERSGLEYDTTNSTAGFGFLHDGRVDRLERFVLNGTGIKFTNEQQVANLVAFLLSANNKDPQGIGGLPGAHTAVGRQFALNRTNFPSLLTELNRVKQSQDVELVVRGYVQGQPSAWYQNQTDTFQGSRRGQIMSNSQMTALVSTNDTFVMSVVPGGYGARLVQDRDLDGVFDEDELARGSNPADRSVVPNNTAPQIQSIPDLIVAPGEKLAFTINGTDKDQPPQRLSYRFTTNVLAGATLNSTNGQFTFAPSTDLAGEVGFFEIQVTDSGSPSLTNSVQFAIAVVPPVTATITNVSLALSWSSKTNQAFRLEYSGTLSSGAWITAVRDITTTNRVTHLSQALAGTNRFYRLVLE